MKTLPAANKSNTTASSRIGRQLGHTHTQGACMELSPLRSSLAKEHQRATKAEASAWSAHCGATAPKEKAPWWLSCFAQLPHRSQTIISFSRIMSIKGKQCMNSLFPGENRRRSKDTIMCEIKVQNAFARLLCYWWPFASALDALFGYHCDR